jgi:leucyl aminopeptidase
MDLELLEQNWLEREADALILTVFEEDDFSEGLSGEVNDRLGGLLRKLKERREWRGRQGHTLQFLAAQTPQVERIILVSAGSRDRAHAGHVRTAVSNAVRGLARSSVRRLVAVVPGLTESDLGLKAVVAGVVQGTFDPGLHKTIDPPLGGVENLSLVVPASMNREHFHRLADESIVIGEAANLARELVAQPGNVINPASFSSRSREVAESLGLTIEVLEEDDLRRQGLASILAVAQGSRISPRLVILQHRGAPNPSDAPVALIGKGVTFDSGGISLKPATSMEEMKADKAGACVVLGAMAALAQLEVPRNVVAALPLVENLPGGSAQRPGDVIRSFSGKSIEIINTDAEGRLILADALSYVRDRFSPEFLVDIATLTGACVVALGHVRAGLFCNHTHLLHGFLQAAQRAGEDFWQLPLDPEYGRELESNIADIKNVGSRWGGAIQAAKFLEGFVGTDPWCHIDMAGLDLSQGENEKGIPTGFGVHTLTEVVRSVLLTANLREHSAGDPHRPPSES